jgi:2-oxo-4-hydroxy-4-carboxy-5-ureidoimidazoline decarboxylase
VSKVLARWNELRREEAEREILACCGSRTWAASMVSKRPMRDEASLLAASDAAWQHLQEADWLEAFRSHPRIGETRGEKTATPQSTAWAAQEQQKAEVADDSVRMKLKRSNREYEQKFGRIFIVCATGKSAGEILEILKSRLQNDEATELRQAAEEQRKIMNLRLKKWIAG